MQTVTPADPALLSLLRTLEAKTAVACEAGRDTTPVGPFLATVHRTSDLIWASCAVPLSDRRDEPVTGETIHRLREVFAARGRLLRFEFFESLWPNLGGELEAFGLKRQGAMPLMICAQPELRPLHAPGVTVHPLDPRDDEHTLRRFLATAKAAFGETEGMNADVSADEVRELRDNLRCGRYRCAWAELDGRMAGVGSMTVANDELVGIGTLPAFRRRGVATAVSCDLLRDHFRHRAPLAWLSAGNDAAFAAYARIGFRAAGVQLNYWDK